MAVFYIQVFSRTHGIPDSVGFYTVSRCPMAASLTQVDRFYHQLAMVNAASIPGRVVLNMLTPKFGVFNLVLFSGVAYAVVIFGLFGINNTGGVVVFALLSGFLAGACTYPHCFEIYGISRLT